MHVTGVAEYDEHGFIYRGRIISPDPGRAPDRVWSCPDCGALVIDTDRRVHGLSHELSG